MKTRVCETLGWLASVCLGLLLVTQGNASTESDLAFILSAQPSGSDIVPDVPITIEIQNKTTKLAATSLTLIVNTNQVSPTLTTTGEVTRVTYIPDTLWKPGTSYTVIVTFNDDATPPNATSNQWQFAVVNMNVVPVAYAKPIGSASMPGFTVRTSQSDGSGNSTAWTEDQLAGLHRIISQGFETPMVINYLGSGGTGNFGNDSPFPGLVNGDNFALEAVAYLLLPRGVYRFGVNSDDGFRLSAGNTPHEIGVVLGEYNGGRGVSDSQFDFVVETNGIYPFRLTFEEGGGSYALEWFSVDRATGAPTLINDTNVATSIQAFRFCSTLSAAVAITNQPASIALLTGPTATFQVAATSGSITNPYYFAYQWLVNGTNIPGANASSYTTPALMQGTTDRYRCLVTLPGYEPLLSDEATIGVLTPLIVSANPGADATGVMPDQTLTIAITNRTTQIKAQSLQLWHNGTNVTASASVSSFAQGLLVNYLPGVMWQVNTMNTIALSFNDNASPANVISNSWQFTTADMPVLLESFAKPLASANTPGFSVRTSQSSGGDNSTAWTEDQLAGLHPIISQGYENPQLINYWGNSGVGNFGGDRLFPGIVNDNYFALEAVAYLALNRGVYSFGVNSDDGFRLTTGALPQDKTLVLGEFSGGRGASDTIFTFFAVTNGLYPFRLTFEEGYGGFALEWFSVNRSTGEKTLINDTNGANPVLAYRYSSGFTNLVVILQNPKSTNIFEQLKATVEVNVLYAGATNPPGLLYQWQANGTDIPGANGPSYTTPLLQLTNNQMMLRCLVTLLGYPPLPSSEAILTINPDTIPPLLVTAGTLLAAKTVHVVFDSLVSPVLATNVANYEFSNGAVARGAVLLPDGKTVALDVSGFSYTNATLKVNNVKDLAGNTIAANTTTTVAQSSLEAQDIGTPGDPVEPGSVYSVKPGDYDVVAGGSDIWNNQDHFNFVYEVREGDFDVKVQVAREDQLSSWTKAGIMMRENLSPGSRNLKIVVNPPGGANAYEVHVRDQQDGGSSGWPNLSNTSSPGIPNAWMRLRREGDDFSAYRGTNGVNWVRIATGTFIFPQRIYLGLCTSSVNNGGGQTTVAWYRNYGDWSPGTKAPVAMPDLLVKGTGEDNSKYAVNGIYQIVPVDGQVNTIVTLPNVPASFQARVENDGQANQTFLIRSRESAETGWTVAYKVGDSNITSQILSPEGWMTDNLAPGSNQVITIEITPGIRPPALTTKSATLQVFLESLSPNIRDAVQAVARVAPVSQPDLTIRRQIDINYAGKNIYNNDGTGQTKTLEVDPNQPAYYLLQLLNNGNTNNQFILTGSSAGNGWTAKYFGTRQAIRFPVDSDYVEVPDAAPLDFGTNDFTVEAWIKVKTDRLADRAEYGIVNKNATYEKSPGWGMEISSYGTYPNVTARFYITDQASWGLTIATSEPLANNTWYHIAGVRSGNKSMVYINGELSALVKHPDAAGNVDNTQSLIIGKHSWGPAFPGLMDDVIIWRGARSDSQIKNDMLKTPNGNEPGLVACWDFNTVEGAKVPDNSTNGLSGTLVNGAVGDSNLDELSSETDLTAQMTTAGFSNVVLRPAGVYELLVQVTPSASVAGGAMQELLVNAKSVMDTSKSDTVKAVTSLTKPSATAEGGLYTSDADFERGILVGVNHSQTPNQLQLMRESVTYPYIWVPNSNEGTVSKVDTFTGKELGRYRTGAIGDGNPSRTTVDLKGNCWVGNRQRATVVKIGLLENGQYVDRNGNGIIETSRDLNGDGDIRGSEILDWGKDECVLFEVLLVPGQEQTYVPGTQNVPYANDYWNPGPRGIAVDAKDNVWVGTYGSRMFYYIDGSTGKILKTVDVSSVNHTSYGALITPDGIIWSAGQDKRHVLKLNPADDSFTTIGIPHYVYGIGLDMNNHLFASGWQDSKLSRVDVVNGVVEWTVQGINESRGVAITEDGDVWIANSAPGTVARWSNDGILKTTIPVGNTPTGVAVDAAGKVWVVNVGDEYIKRIDPATDLVDLSKRIIGATHYGYSDMTGILARNATTRIGYWSIIHNSKTDNTPWGQVTWHSLEPAGTSIKARVRSSNDQVNWSLWESVVNNDRLYSTPPGKYLEVEATLQSFNRDVTPILYDLAITPATQINLGQQVYNNDFQSGIGPEWSATNTDVTPLNSMRFLGQFGNQTASLTLTNLPAHSVVSVLYDLFVIRTWDGNSTTNGPDIWELNVAGGRKLFYTTFNNGPTNSVAAGQAYPDSFPGGAHPARMGASETNSLGFTVPNAGVMDSVYMLGYTFAHSADSLELNFSASGLSTNLLDESWGLDNVRVYITPLAPSVPLRLLPLGMTNKMFRLQLQGEAQQTYVIEASTNLVNWSAVSTNTLTSNKLDMIDTASPSFRYRFYRAGQK